MLFYSVKFVIFFILFFAFYWFGCKQNVKHQNILLLIASYIFYGWVDWRFLPILIGASVINYGLGIQLSKTEKYKKLILNIGLIQGIGMLLYFKYFNFFISSINDFLQLIGFHSDLKLLHIIVPLGISFFTFRTLSYILDIYNRKIEPTHDWVVFFNYIAFFPTILSGPIDRSKPFISQLEKKREFDYPLAVDGMRQILWGLLKKLVIADNCAVYANQLLDNSIDLPASSRLLGAVIYAFQMYSDFSGYSDMAIGISKLIGFRVTKNFNYPFFAQNIAEYWRRWHMSLTSWLTDYVFTPISIALRDYDKLGLIIAILINFIVVGLWHGANWTYVLFGVIHGCYFIPLILRGTMNKRKKKEQNKTLPSPKELIQILSTFALAVFAFIMFRANNVGDAFITYRKLFSMSLFSLPVIPASTSRLLMCLFFALAMLIVEWIQRDKEYGLQIDHVKSLALRVGIYYLIIFVIGQFAATNQQEFIYFQF